MWTHTQGYWNHIYKVADMVLNPHCQFFQQNVVLFDALLEF